MATGSLPTVTLNVIARKEHSPSRGCSVKHSGSGSGSRVEGSEGVASTRRRAPSVWGHVQVILSGLRLPTPSRSSIE
eukprot:2977655-Rhodomonas_salina.1